MLVWFMCRCTSFIAMYDLVISHPGVSVHVSRICPSKGSFIHLISPSDQSMRIKYFWMILFIYMHKQIKVHLHATATGSTSAPAVVAVLTALIKVLT